MPAFILDTDTLSLYQHGHPRVGPAVDARPPGTLGVTVITAEEQFTGWLSLVRRVKQPNLIAAAYDGWADTVFSYRRFDILTYSVSAIARYEQLDRMKLRIGGMDLRIGAIALEHGAAVVTRNRAHFGRIPGLTIVDWSV
jgi:tRNA(fMet)-specific endonuclease VapC